MRIIKDIEISYFRSAYRIKLKNLRDVNVFSGRNDAGKSNILKAMNLFFNGQTDWQTNLEFYRDFSSQRLVQVRKESVKGKQFISIAIHFYRPESYKFSLPETFRVIRTWHRKGSVYTERDNLESSINSDKLPSTIATAKRFLPIFLNRVHFEYVPAVKERLYFKDILARLQKALLVNPTETDTQISRTADNLAEHIQSKIVKLQKDFERSTKIQSFIVPPAELASLFQAFLVSTNLGEEHKIPLALRGDGIQARYVSSVLRYICENSRDFFIWGFEEPENSLEYSHVVQLAEDIEKVYSKTAQIFLTTHSPALTALRSDDATCYRIFCDANGISKMGSVWPERGSAAERTKLNIEMGNLKLQENLHAEYIAQNERFEKLQKNIAILEQEARVAQKPLVFVEGKTDRRIMEIAWQKCLGSAECPVIFRDADPTGTATGRSAGGASSLKQAIESVFPDDNRKTIAIFDRDQAGLKAYNKLSKNFRSWQRRDDVKVHINRLAFALLLPIPSGRENYAETENLSIEFMFPDIALNTHTADGRGLSFKRPTQMYVHWENMKIKVPRRELPLPPDKLESLQKITNGKNVFANEIVPILDRGHFQAFEPLFQTIEDIITWHS